MRANMRLAELKVHDCEFSELGEQHRGAFAPAAVDTSALMCQNSQLACTLSLSLIIASIAAVTGNARGDSQAHGNPPMPASATPCASTASNWLERCCVVTAVRAVTDKRTRERAKSGAAKCA